MYETGNGSVRARAIYTREHGNIVITALPHQVSPTKIIEQIAEQMRTTADDRGPARRVIINNRSASC
jgi:DNA gyrase/topoisomerase IV subunit A